MPLVIGSIFKLVGDFLLKSEMMFSKEVLIRFDDHVGLWVAILI